MSYVIAVAGKGGVGKTTVAGMMVRWLVEHDKTPILAVDADSNSNFNEVLGLELEGTLGEAREDMKKGQSEGMTKNLFIEMRVNQSLAEAEGFDLIAMGRPEGAGCYCAANHLLTESMDKLADNYNYLVVDNEAGMEHISRVTTQHVDLLLVVSDPSRRSLQAAQRVTELAKEMKVLRGKSYLVLSMVRGEPSPELLATVKEMGLELAGVIPDDPMLADYDLKGLPTSTLPMESPAKSAAFKVFDKVMAEAQA
ncbi:MAG: AAA family ATPase [Desulfarculus sp.]|nr:AAA family ATPase [Pseudomonadota bacterium]MBV1715002.1 AAA family ATPase [Desulfarculus sp.]MBU4573485.1 AAA family ATPase [Pseudomonadota bacterium]MBU4599725.1 AAA family ATPase [Pseudomonadota bacterium]MBV1739954.1 AAA family ATPase [Desulfarculus sp.]